MTLAEFFQFLYDNGLDYSVNVLHNQKRSCALREYMVIAVNKNPMFMTMGKDRIPLFFEFQILKFSSLSLYDFNMNGVGGYIISIDLKTADMNSDTLLVLAKKIWEEYIHAGY